jgi:hypothetical protein
VTSSSSSSDSQRWQKAVDRYACPLCGSPKGSPCLYLDVKEPRVWPRNEKAWARYALNGTPTTRPHNDRLVLVSRPPARPTPAPIVWEPYWTPEYWAAIESLRRHDLREYQEMREWLLTNGHILWDR